MNFTCFSSLPEVDPYESTPQKNNSFQVDLIFPLHLERRLTLLLIFALPDKLTNSQFQVEHWLLSRTGPEGQGVWVNGDGRVDVSGQDCQSLQVP